MNPVVLRRSLLAAPLGLAAIGGVSAYTLLERMARGTYDPHTLPSMLIGRPLPNFTLPGQPPGAGFSNRDVSRGGKLGLVNFFASWCVPCLQEAPELMKLAAMGVALWGIAYKDSVANTAGFLSQNGNPYHAVARDAKGMTAINFGLYGVPETYLVDPTGIVRWRWAGGISPDLMANTLLPLLKRYA